MSKKLCSVIDSNMATLFYRSFGTFRATVDSEFVFYFLLSLKFYHFAFVYIVRRYLKDPTVNAGNHALKSFKLFCVAFLLFVHLSCLCQPANMIDSIYKARGSSHDLHVSIGGYKIGGCGCCSSKKPLKPPTFGCRLGSTAFSAISARLRLAIGMWKLLHFRTRQITTNQMKCSCIRRYLLTFVQRTILSHQVVRFVSARVTLIVHYWVHFIRTEFRLFECSV